jgi:hypothetical protein
MAENVFVRGESDSSFKAMTKEEVLAAIVQAVEGGTVGDIDTGFVTIIKEQNKGQGLMFWVGTTAEYEALTTKPNNVLYIKTDDTSAADINNAIAAVQSSLGDLNNAIAAAQSSLGDLNNRVGNMENLFANDSGWQTLTISSTQGGFSAPTSGNKIPSYRKIGNHVYIQGFVIVNMGEAGPPDVNSPFAQLPSEFVPSHFFYLHAPGQGAREAGVLVDQSGYLSMAYFKDSTGANVTSGEYWFQIDCDFLTD